MARVQQQSCAYCQGTAPMTDGCTACAAPHHDECWLESGGCANPRCPSRAAAIDRDDTPPLGLPVAAQPVPAPSASDPKRGWLWMAIAAGFVAIGIGVVLVVFLRDSGPQPVVQELIPQVTDFQWQEARTKLEEAGFIPVHEGVVTQTGTDGAVFEQDPPANSRAPLGSFVEIFYAIIPEEDETAPPTPVADAAQTPGTPTPDPGATGGEDPAPVASDSGPTSAPASVSPIQALDPPWIAIVHSPDNEDDARNLYQQRYAKDYPNGGVLFSSDFAQMRPGFWVVYLDQFESQTAAEAFCTATYGTPTPGRQPDCYTRTTES